MLEAHADRVNSQNPANVQCAPLGNGQKEVNVHLKSLTVRNGSSRIESQLLLAKGRHSMNISIVIFDRYCSMNILIVVLSILL